MSLTNPNTPVSQQDLQDFYHKILPYLGSSSSAMSDLTDVDLDDVQDGQVLKWDNGNRKWVNANESGGGSSSAVFLSQTLIAGNTSVTFRNVPMAGNYAVDFFTSTGINYTAIDVTTAGQVTLTFDAQSEDVFVYCRIEEMVTTDVPNGKYVTPTDDITTWLECAGLKNFPYTTLTEILNDSTTLLLLINSNNAVDYMVRSTTWATDVCANSTAMADISANNYCANTLLADSTWRSAICNSVNYEIVLNVKIPVMTSDTTPSGVASSSAVWKAGYEAYRAFNGDTSQTQGWIGDTHVGGWLQYDFENPVYLYLFDYKGGVNGSYRALKNFKIQGSNNGVDFVDLTDNIVNSDNTLHTSNPITINNNIAYRYVRMNCDTTETSQAFNGVAVLQVYGRTDV